MRKTIILILVCFLFLSPKAQANDKPIIKSASEYDYPPFSIVHKDGRADGFTVELLRAALKAVNYEVSFKTAPWSQIKKELAEGKIQVLPFMGRTPEREATYDFTFTYLELEGAVFVRKGDKRIKTPKDLTDKEIIVMAASTSHEYAIKSKISEKIIPVASNAEAMKLLITGKHDAVITQHLMGIKLLKDMKINEIVPLKQRLSDFRQHFAFAVKEGDKNLLALLNEGLSLVMTDGTYEELYKKWFIPILDPHTVFRHLFREFLPYTISVIFFICACFIIFLRIEVKKKTKSLILEKEKAEENEKYIAMLFQLSPIGLVLTTPEGNILDTNHAYTDITGYTKEELQKKSYWDFTPNEYIEEEKKQLTKFKETGTYGPYEKEYIHKSGKLIPVRLHGRIIYKNGKKLFWSSIENITDQKQLEEFRIENTFLLNETGKMAKVGGWKLDLKTNKLTWTKELYRIHEVDDDFIPTVETALNFYEEKSKPIISEAVKHAIENGKPFDLELKLITAKKNKLHVRAIGYATKLKDGKHHFLYGAFQDIDVQKKIEHELILAKEKAEENDRLKSAFLANMSHEIRTPMNGILGFASILKESELPNEEQREYVDIIEKSGQRMLNLINDLINISKIESGLMEIYKSETCINEQFKFIMDFFTPETKAKGIRLIMDAPLSNKQATINTDTEKFSAILINLVKNAIKFTDKGSITFGYKLNENMFEFYIKDTGLGIPKEKQTSIFERFFQADIKMSRGYEGSGLGLSISKAYTEMLGGRMWFESEYGKGTQFYFTLPFETKAIQSEQKKEAVQPKLKTANTQATILITEDDNTSLMYLKYLLKTHYNLRTATTGQEAIEACRKYEDIDLVLIDIQMPDMDGITATAQIRKTHPKLPVIAQTAFALQNEIDKYKDIFDGYLTKPINPEQIKQEIARLLK